MKINHPYPARPTFIKCFVLRTQICFCCISTLYYKWVDTCFSQIYKINNVFLIINYIGGIHQIAKVNNVHFESGGFPSPWSVFASMLVTL